MVTEYTVAVSQQSKKDLDEIRDELKANLMVSAVSYDRAIKELLIHYRASHPVQDVQGKTKKTVSKVKSIQ